MGKKYNINYQIEAEEVNLVLSDGNMKKNILLSEALEIANNEALDVVEMSNKEGEIPICKILDYGKMMYQLNKKKKQNKHFQHTKEIKYNFNISEHDLNVKHKKVLEFLSKKYIVRYALELKGRERGMIKDALNKINEHLQVFRDISTWKDPNISQGNRICISTVLHPL